MAIQAKAGYEIGGAWSSGEFLYVSMQGYFFSCIELIVIIV